MRFEERDLLFLCFVVGAFLLAVVNLVGNVNGTKVIYNDQITETVFGHHGWIWPANFLFRAVTIIGYTILAFVFLIIFFSAIGFLVWLTGGKEKPPRQLTAEELAKREKARTMNVNISPPVQESHPDNWHNDDAFPVTTSSETDPSDDEDNKKPYDYDSIPSYEGRGPYK